MFLFKVTPDGGETFEVKASTRDVLMWEKTGRDRSLTGLTEKLHVADMYEIAYLAAKRQGLFDGARAEFEASVELDFQEDQDAADPTSAAPSIAL